MKILLGNFNDKVGREDIFKPTIGNGSLYEISNDIGARAVTFATSKISQPKVRCSHIATLKIYLDVCRWEIPQSDSPYSGRQAKAFECT
jgi:hypothetical protein